VSFAKALSKLKVIEGGYVFDPNDSGGETNHGITKRLAVAHGYTGEMINLTSAQAGEIFRAQFWDSQNLDLVDAVSADVAAEIFEAGVNVGEVTAGRWFQRALNALNMNGKYYSDLVVDGRIGRVTAAAFKEYLDRRPGGVGVMLRVLNSLQGTYYVDLAERRKKDETFVFGWFKNRVLI
jgi:lysozyme family protein